MLELENGEFLILEDKGCHMVGQSQVQMQFTPSTLSLTNFHIFLNPQFDNEIMRKIALSDITKFSQKTVDDSLILEILSEDAAQSIYLFIPEDSHRQAFATIFKKLCAANDLGQEKCNECALKLRRKIQNSGNLNAFYEMINAGQEEENDNEMKEQRDEIQLQNFISFFDLLFKVCDFIADVVDTSPIIAFSTIVVIIVAFTILFKFVKFGVFVPFCLFEFSVFIGLLKNDGKIKVKTEDDFNAAPRNIKEFMLPFTQFNKAIKSRFMWLVPDQTLEACEFLLALTIMFKCLDPFFILAASLFLLAFFERWDPFHFGSFSAFLSHLILW